MTKGQTDEEAAHNVQRLSSSSALSSAVVWPAVLLRTLLLGGRLGGLDDVDVNGLLKKVRASAKRRREASAS